MHLIIVQTIQLQRDRQYVKGNSTPTVQTQ